MKKTLLITFAVLIVLIVPFCAFADNSDIDFDNFDNSFSIYTNRNIENNQQVIFGMPAENFDSYMKNNSMVLYGTDNKSVVFNVSHTKTDFSTKTVDFLNYTDSTLLEFADTFTEYNDGIISINNLKFVVIKADIGYDADFPEVRQYVTVKNGGFYVITINFIEGFDKVDEMSADILGRFSISTTSNTNYSFAFVLVIVVLIILVVFVIVNLIVSIIKDLKNK